MAACLMAFSCGCDKTPAAEEVVELQMPGNPFITELYLADPSAHVWSDGRLYVYPSHDVAPPRGCDLMDRESCPWPAAVHGVIESQTRLSN